MHGLAPLPVRDASLQEELEECTIEELQFELKEHDPQAYELIDQNNKRRLIRAVEVVRQGALPSQLHAEHSFSNLDYSALIILLELEREKLYQRINQRTLEMLKSGLVDETTSLVRHYGHKVAALQALGYRQVLDQLVDTNEHAEQNLEQDLFQEISKYTRRYAKRQLTFWRNEPEKSAWKRRKTLKNVSKETLRPLLQEIEKEVHLYAWS